MHVRVRVYARARAREHIHKHARSVVVDSIGHMSMCLLCLLIKTIS